MTPGSKPPNQRFQRTPAPPGAGSLASLGAAEPRRWASHERRNYYGVVRSDGSEGLGKGKGR